MLAGGNTPHVLPQNPKNNFSHPATHIAPPRVNRRRAFLPGTGAGEAAKRLRRVRACGYKI